MTTADDEEVDFADDDGPNSPTGSAADSESSSDVSSFDTEASNEFFHSGRVSTKHAIQISSDDEGSSIIELPRHRSQSTVESRPVQNSYLHAQAPSAIPPTQHYGQLFDMAHYQPLPYAENPFDYMNDVPASASPPPWFPDEQVPAHGNHGLYQMSPPPLAHEELPTYGNRGLYQMSPPHLAHEELPSYGGADNHLPSYGNAHGDHNVHQLGNYVFLYGDAYGDDGLRDFYLRDHHFPGHDFSDYCFNHLINHLPVQGNAHAHPQPVHPSQPFNSSQPSDSSPQDRDTVNRLPPLQAFPRYPDPRPILPSITCPHHNVGGLYQIPNVHNSVPGTHRPAPVQRRPLLKPTGQGPLPPAPAVLGFNVRVQKPKKRAPKSNRRSP